MATVKWTQIKNEKNAKDIATILKVGINPSRVCTIKFGKKIAEHMKVKKGETAMVCFNPANLYELMICKNYDTGYKVGLDNPHVPEGFLKIAFKARGKMEKIPHFSSVDVSYSLEDHNQVVLTIPKVEKTND